jgi:acyl-CoA reductase-like NAD-dependent aldehyde dehydrogenase
VARAEGGSAQAVREALARAREAGERLAARPLAARLEPLGAWLETLADPASAVRRELEATLPEATGYAPETLREGLARGLAPFRSEALRALVAAELGPAPDAGRRATGFPVTAQLLAGAVPTATVPALLAPLVVGSPVVAKPPVHDPVTAPCLARSLAALDAELGACVQVVAFRGEEEGPLAALLEADCVVATGSDETVARVAARVAPPRRLVAYGHRLSLAVLGPDVLGDATRRRRALERLALDTALWDQQGCLSPLALYAVGDAAPRERLLDETARALAAAEARWPRGRLDPHTLGAARRERELAELRAAGGADLAWRADPEGRWTVVAEPDALFRGAPPARFLRIHPARDLAELARALAPVAPHLAAVAVDGFDDEATRRGLHDLLARRGASRICPPGSLQAPPLSWPHDNRPLLLPLTRLTSIEP